MAAKKAAVSKKTRAPKKVTKKAPAAKKAAPASRAKAPKKAAKRAKK